MVAALFVEGDHEPVILLFEVVGNGEIGAPVQIGPTRANVGTIG